MSAQADPALNLVAIQPHCRSLRCKEMFIDTGREFRMEESGSGIYWCSHTRREFRMEESGSGIYWCSHTQTCLGPDGNVADTEHCKSGRGCYEAL